MSQREKILAAVVGAVLVLAGGFFLMDRVNKMLAAKRAEVEQAERDLSQRRLAVRAGQIAGERILEYERRSLPVDLSEARSQYQEWLLGVTYEYFGENKMLVKPSGGAAAVGGVYDRLEYSIAGEGNLDELTRFLHRFYDVNYLHRINLLRIQPISDSKNLRISCEIEALIVKTTSKKKLGNERGDRIPPDSLNDYLADILNRNVFGRPNEPPQLASVRTQSAYRNRTFRETISARDPDDLDSISFRLEDGPEGIRLEQDGSSAELSWLPTEKGTYDVTVSVADNGLPSKSDFLTFQIEVVDPPEPEVRPTPTPPRFDFAKYTFLTSVQAIDGKPIIWLYSRPTAKKIVCSEGEEIEIGDYQALVRRIDVEQNQIELEVEDEVQVLRLGQNLREAQLKSSGKVGQASSSGVAPRN